jgi:formamidopyrimidine-DNA glycosylase
VPELPDITIYIDALRPRTVGRVLRRVRIASPFLLRTFDPPLEAAHGKTVVGLSRLGKRIVFELEDELYLVLHLMIAGRLHWKGAGAKVAGKQALAAFDFEEATLTLTESSAKKRASLHVVRGAPRLAGHRPEGIEILDCSLANFAAALTLRNHTLKRALTSPALFSGIGNAYSDEILHRARLSPVAHTQRLSPDEIASLHAATQAVMREWIERLRQETGDGFPERVTAFRPEMAVHGKFGEPCPVCGAPVQRIRYAANETNYCARCQTGGRVLADRSLSRLLKDDWPRRIEDWE